MVTGRVSRSIVSVGANKRGGVEVWETPPGYFLAQDGPLVVDLPRRPFSLALVTMIKVVTEVLLGKAINPSSLGQGCSTAAETLQSVWI